MGQPQEPDTPLRGIGGFRLGEWLVRQAEGMLSGDRKSVRLEPRVMDMLVYLAAQPGRVVSRDELLKAVWGGAFVEEGVLSQAVHSLRKALGDDARQPRYIETIPKRGYRLLAPVVPEKVIAAPRVEPGRIGPYRLEDRLGAGGMGVVYRAYDERLRRWVAIKLVPPDRSGDPVHRERLRREAQASAGLIHPAVVRIYDLIQTAEADAIVMELVEGRRLADMLRDGPLELNAGLALARQIAGALAEAHAHGIIHRDLKTENVLVTLEGQAKVVDFGIARWLDPVDAALTSAGVVLGTFRAMAPEQAEGGEAEPRSDLFSFGVLLYELFTGRSPFLAPTPGAILLRVCTQRQKPAREVDPRLPEELSSLIDRLLEKKPDLRPESAAKVALSLERIASRVRTSSGHERRAAAAITAEQTPGPQAEAAPPFQGSAERRQVTALSCGLAMAGDPPLDPEDLLEEMPALQDLLAEVVDRYEGHLDRRRGRGWAAWFGYPQAHEDDARRAVRAALEIAARAGQISAARRGAAALRIGLHTGPMIGTAMGSSADDYTAVSDTPEVASLVQSLAAPGEVLVSPATHRLIAGFFDCEDLAPVSLPGGAPPLRAWRVLADSGQTRIEAAGTLTPLVGREQELGLLLERWALAREGAGQVLLLAGEAGLGKSRLVWELRQRVTAGAAGWLEAHGSPYHRDSAFHPIRELLQRWLAAGGDEPPQDQLVRLEQELARLVPDLPQAVPLLASLLSLPEAERHALPPTSPEERRRQTIEAILALLLAMAERQPLLLVVEDLHWLDPSSLELLGLLIEHAAAVPLLLLLTFRPELRSPWEQRSDLTRLTLSPLSRTQVGLMVERLTDERSLAPAVREQIAARTDGVPLFVEELTKMILEAGSATGSETSSGRPSLEIPATLDGWLRARLDRLGPAREIAQLAAVLGREIPAGLLHAVAPGSEEHLERELDRLVAAEILFRRGRPPHQRYLFKHALLQDAAYASLLRADRRRHHLRIAEVLERRFPEVVESQPEMLAHHYTEAGLPERAIPLWRRAGERAIHGSAYLEASGHFQRALALLGELPENDERVQQEIALQVDLGMALAAIKTFSTPEVQRAFQRAWELCGRVGQTPQVFTALRGLLINRLISGDMHSGLEVAEQLHEMARQEGPNLLRVSHQGLGFILLCRGELARARTHLEEAISLFESTDWGVDLSLPGSGNLPLEARANLSWTLWLLGYPDEALQCSREALAQARKLSATFSRCFVSYFASEIHAYRREPEEVRTQIEELASLATEQGFSHFISVAVFLRAWAEAVLGGGSSAIGRMREGIEGRLALGARAGIPNHLALLADCLLQADRVPEGLAAVEEGLEISSSGGQCLFDAELWRVKGELLRRGGSPDSAVEELFGRALDVARRQSARSLELRAAMSLARLWAGQGRKGEARELLSKIYGRFTEGFDTGDLREARALLEK